MILDNLLILSILLVFLTAIIGTFARRRRKDRVLRDIDDFDITLKRKGKAAVWGRAKVFSNGIEFLFKQPYKNRRNNSATSFLLYKQEYQEVEGLFRFHDDLTEDKQKVRRRSVNAVISKRWYLVFGRLISNFLNTFRDAINESMGLLLTRVRGQSLASSDAHMKQLSTTATSLLGQAYDPILEHHIGDAVILEQTLQDRKVEYVGTLHEYSDSWISLYDCRLEEDGKQREVDVYLPRTITWLRNAGIKKNAAE